MLKETSAIVEKGIKAEKSLEQLKSEKALAKYESFAWQYISADGFLEMLHRGLSK